MNPIPGFESKRKGYAFAKIPTGGYVAKIQNAELLEYPKSTKIRISYDICEGEYKDFFKNDYLSNKNDKKFWHGIYDLWVPTGDASNEMYAKNLATLQDFVACVEESNEDYHWDWNLAGLKGKLVGVVIGEKEWAKNGKTGWNNECRWTKNIAEIREGNVTIPEPLPLSEKQKRENAVPAVEEKDLDDIVLPWA